jgi:hypothetical protein
MVLVLVRILMDFDDTHPCTVDLKNHINGYIIILIVCVLLELSITWLSLRGTILDPEPRKYMEYLLYFRLGNVLSLSVSFIYLFIFLIYLNIFIAHCSCVSFGTTMHRSDHTTKTMSHPLSSLTFVY